MPKKTTTRRNGVTTRPNTKARQAAQRKYNSKPEQIKRRAQRNAARAKLMKAGKVRKGDGKDVDHKNHNTADMSTKNLRIQSPSKNRSNDSQERKAARKTMK